MRQFASIPITVLLVIAASSVGVCLSAIEAQSRPQSAGIDSSLFAKAKAGDISSQVFVGHAYLKGEGVPQDYAQAALWYRKAADQGDAKAEYELGVLYYKGHGVQQDQLQAVSWFHKAADQEDAKAQFALGWHYQHYWGAGQDHAQSVVWYRKAAEKGFAKAQFELGEMYYVGDTVPQDMALAEMWAQKAADQGNVEAQKLSSTLAALKATRREERRVTILVAICLVVLAWLVSLLVRKRERLIHNSNRLIPRTLRAKKLAVLLLLATWCSVSCLYQLFDPWMLAHPIDAAATALLFSAPAVIFGAVYLWWLSQAKKDI